MEQQLYIDGVLVDIEKNVDITLEYKSNLFNDVSKLSTNRSYTVKLPATAKNCSIFGNVETIKSDTSFPYRLHRADLFRNGVQIISNGRAVVMSVAGTFEISLVWGLFPAFNKLLEDGTTLNQLSDDSTISFSETPDLSLYTGFISNGIGYARYNSFKNKEGDLISNSWQAAVNVRTAPTLIVGVWSFGTKKIGSIFPNTISIGETDTYSGYFDINPSQYPAFYLSGAENSSLEVAYVDDNERLLNYISTYNRAEITVGNTPAPSCVKVYFTIRGWSKLTLKDVYLVTRETEISGKQQKEVDTSKLDHGHPSVTAKWILNRITQEKGVKFEFDAETDSFINSLALPLISKKSDTNERGVFEGHLLAQKSSLAGNTALTWQMEKNTIPFVVPVDMGETSTHVGLRAQSDCVLRVECRFNCIYDSTNAVSSDGYTLTPFGAIKVYRWNESEKKHDEDPEVLLFGVAASKDVERVKSQNIEITCYGDIEMNALDDIQFGVGLLQPSGGDVHGTFSVYDASENVPYGGNYPIVTNLPQIKITDFIKSLCVLSGTYPLQDYSNNTIRFARYDTIKENRSNAVDWSSRLVSDDMPKEIKTTISDFVQNNWYKWKEDDSVKSDYNGNLQIYNETLDAKKDVITLPFAATDGNNRIPLYTRETEVEDGVTSVKYEYKEVKERIMQVFRASDNYAELRFGLNLQTILNEKYRFIRECLYNAVVIKEKVQLSDVDLLNYDETLPVYLAKYGAYFAVTDIKAGNTGIADVTMLKLKF